MTDSFTALEMEDIPWDPVGRSLNACKVALVTTAGVHLRDQPPFDMHHPDGDPSFKTINGSRSVADLMITHDYYDHSDADKDINIVFPIERLRDLASEGVMGAEAETHYGFMVHITGPHIKTLISQTAPDLAEKRRAMQRTRWS
jgi:D-proline reductase (dithiol) PrdB